jgi:Ca2+-transporting ATPase
MAGEGLRVLAVARRDFDPATFDPQGDLLALMSELELLALIGIVDPPPRRPRTRSPCARTPASGCG